MTSNSESQLASAVLMIRSARFESNPLTAASNRFQGKLDISPAQQQLAAAAEFEAVRCLMEDSGVRVICVDDTLEPHTPDSIFPNNWVSFHADGTVVLYPMEAANRRSERRGDIIDSLSRDHGFQVTEVVDISHHENARHHLEGTGSMVLDRANRVAYASLSSRTHLEVLGDFAQRLDYDIVAFDAVDQQGMAIYHTNVLMNIGESLAVICAEAIPRADQRDAIEKRLKDTGHEVLQLSFAQLEAFAGNMLELRSSSGERLIAMSTRARNSLDDTQLARIAKHAAIVDVEIDNIEDSAGGSVRCMLAEIHLPRN